MSRKRTNGQFFTVGNPFNYAHFKNWAQDAGLPENTLLEPFAGANHIVNRLIEEKLCKKFTSYDLYPENPHVRQRNTIKNFPTGFDICITNPPWLARNSATRRKLAYPNTPYDDLYKHCLALCLENCQFVAALVPASFLHARLFRKRLTSYTLLHNTLFDDTENPVCIALFNDRESEDVSLYYDKKYIGTLNELEKQIPNPQIPNLKDRQNIRFNDPQGQLGFISFDNTKEPTIKFCHAEEIRDVPIKVSSRYITRIGGDFDRLPSLIDTLNDALKTFRDKTHDIFLTPFKGLRADGSYRRRMDFALARKFINHAT